MSQSQTYTPKTSDAGLNNPMALDRTNSSPTSRQPFGRPASRQEEHSALIDEMADPASNTMTNHNSALPQEDTLPGEVLCLKTVATIYLVQLQRPSTEGSFMITNYKVVFSCLHVYTLNLDAICARSRRI